MNGRIKDGVLIVDKPASMTSARVVSVVKRELAVRRVGHTGTLDPIATGVLPIVLGEATKLASFLLAEDKEYEAELELGVATDTLDADGTVTARAPWEMVDKAGICAVLRSMVGEQFQVPPMHSALKHEGRRLYELARKGVEVERNARPVRVDLFELLDFSPPRARLAVACSKGTYVRALVRDVGERLGCGATLTALRRTRSGRFALDNAIPLEQVGERAASALIPPADAIAHLPALVLDARQAADTLHGRPIQAPPDAPGGALYRLLWAPGALASVARVEGPRMVHVRVFHPDPGLALGSKVRVDTA
ncbi:MAG: tRNA pseudouridine(55) synthase TruB [Deltaproteobacteria bacterium]|nr:tRNA pseudouridine(55) synthase TruB [Deltaproteobacteria bacterium]